MRIPKLIIKLTLGLSLLAALLLAGAWLDYRSYMNTPLLSDGEAMIFEIPPGSSFRRAVTNLSEQGVITRPYYILLHARLSGMSRQIHAGEYQIRPGMRVSEFLDALYSGKVVQYSLTVVEGWTFAQMLEAIRNHPQLTWTLQADTPAGLAAEVMHALGRPEQHPEGRFMPDTYLFPNQLSDIAFLRRAYEAMDRYLEQAWAQRQVGLPYKSPYEALIMASIVEKETGLPSERGTIAGVFVRRLQIGMRLQTDPTVIYGMGERYDGRIRTRDLRTDTPYNTYTRFGLPPTPIALPGRAAITATLNPEDGEYLYFVSRGDGSHHFSATLQEHNRAVHRYQILGIRPGDDERNNSGEDG